MKLERVGPYDLLRGGRAYIRFSKHPSTRGNSPKIFFKSKIEQTNFSFYQKPSNKCSWAMFIAINPTNLVKSSGIGPITQ